MIMNEGKRILIIEDDQEISKLLSVILTKKELDSIVAYSGTEGLLQLQNNKFDLILLDLMLPGKSGEELIKKIREENSIPIIVISAKVDIENKVHVLKMGADDYITKPFRVRELMARVKVQLRKQASLETPSQILRSENIRIDTNLVKVYKNCESITLTNLEYKLLLNGIKRIYKHLLDIIGSNIVILACCR